MSNHNGQSILEAILLLPCAFLLLLCFSWLSYAGFARAWIGFQMDKALFCLAEGTQQWECEKSAKQAMNQFLPFGQIRLLNLQTQPDRWQAKVAWEWNEIHLLKEKSLKWDSSIWR